MERTTKPKETIHASCVTLGPTAVLLIGASGSGKSALALELITRGAVLIADDQTILTDTSHGLRASCPAPLLGLIEARGVGLLTAEHQFSAIVRLVVDLEAEETDRLPAERNITLLGHTIPLLHTPCYAHFPAAVLQYLRGGRSA